MRRIEFLSLLCLFIGQTYVKLDGYKLHFDSITLDYSPLKELKSLIKRQNIKQWNRFFILVYLENIKKARKIK